MSNLWKLAGLGWSRKDFVAEGRALSASIGGRSFKEDAYQKALAEIDKFLVKWYCPLNHLDVQIFYDLICCKPIWDDFEKALEISGLDTTPLDPSDPDAGIFWQVLGLAAFDPWKNEDPDRKGHPGFRQLLQNDINAVDAFGFRLSPKYKQMVATALAKPQILDALQSIAMEYNPASDSMLTFRQAFQRLQPVQLPPGWINTNK